MGADGALPDRRADGSGTMDRFASLKGDKWVSR